MTTSTNPNNASELVVRNDGTIAVYSGPDAVALFRAKVIASALKLYANTGIKANRAYTPSAMLGAAKEITGKDFRGKDKYMNAHDALIEWARTMECALPIVVE